MMFLATFCTDWLLQNRYILPCKVQSYTFEVEIMKEKTSPNWLRSNSKPIIDVMLEYVKEMKI